VNRSCVVIFACVAAFAFAFDFDFDFDFDISYRPFAVRLPLRSPSVP
jgi:hypothetical protein